jgi:hypothetical protein
MPTRRLVKAVITSGACRVRGSILAVFALLPLSLSIVPAHAQQNAREEAERRAAVLASLPSDAARRLFGLVKSPAPGNAHVIGSLTKGCFTGGVQMPADGENWQVMRPSRNRGWGHPAFIAFLKRISKKVADATGWPGILVGDIAQPRGGPMLTGHASHQLGIEADIWMRPMPNQRLSAQEREEMLSIDLVRTDRRDVDTSVYTRQHLHMLRAVATEPQVAHLRQRGNQEGALPRRRAGPRLAVEGEAVVRPQLPFPHPLRLPTRRCLQGSGAAARRRRLQPDRLLVH